MTHLANPEGRGGSSEIARTNDRADKDLWCRSVPKTAELVAQTLWKMIVDEDLEDGDFLPYEADLMAHFQVSRPTLREAVRVLESDRLVEVLRGSRTCAKVRVPGPVILARPAALLLAITETTLGPQTPVTLLGRPIPIFTTQD